MLLCSLEERHNLICKMLRQKITTKHALEIMKNLPLYCCDDNDFDIETEASSDEC